ncbi:MAG: protein kinase, partial [Planctomycetes bacterium]|nr:protein kinase [Planctomycetota bacterium]
MENQKPRSKLGGKPKSDAGAPPGQLAPDTRLENDTPTPNEHDPEWQKLGATRVSQGPADSSSQSVPVESPSNHTEISPSRVLGKNLTRLGDFQLIKKLGEGAMGVVYKARQISFNRTVALKVLFPHVANNPKLVQRLYREGRVMNELDHPNIVQAYAIGEAEGCHYVAMEYISGQSLQKWLNQL